MNVVILVAVMICLIGWRTRRARLWMRFGRWLWVSDAVLLAAAVAIIAQGIAPIAPLLALFGLIGTAWQWHADVTARGSSRRRS